MADHDEPRLIGPAGHPGHARGMAVGCVALLLGLIMTWAVAGYAVRDRPTRTEVNDALYWDGVVLGWGCVGIVLSFTVAIGVGLWAASRAGRKS